MKVHLQLWYNRSSMFLHIYKMFIKNLYILGYKYICYTGIWQHFFFVVVRVTVILCCEVIKYIYPNYNL